ncbi:MAG: GNAT family N-acetyltransferase [Maribacter sp.]
MLEIKVKEFGALSVQELYALLQLRSAIFVVEQNCVYQDVDGKDSKALHVIGTFGDKIIAYTRIFKPGDYFSKASIGRVAVHEDFRTFGYGKDIMNASINAIIDVFGQQAIKISAQTYLIKFYTELGFTVFGEGYLEDGIPHVEMIRN